MIKGRWESPPYSLHLYYRRIIAAHRAQHDSFNSRTYDGSDSVSSTTSISSTGAPMHAAPVQK
eukprot:3591922-Karenia_brevis.AAC.1